MGEFVGELYLAGDKMLTRKFTLKFSLGFTPKLTSPPTSPLAAPKHRFCFLGLKANRFGGA